MFTFFKSKDKNNNKKKVSKYDIKSSEEIELIKNSCRLVSLTIAEVKKYLKPGVSTLALDKIAEEYIRDNGGRPAFKDYSPDDEHSPFPGTLCTSINAQVVHGIPKEDVYLQDGDIISIDCGVERDGYYGDSAYTFAIGESKPEILRLLHITKESLMIGIQKAVHGGRVGDISYAIQRHVEMHGYSVVKELVGHGVGKELHEEPEVPNYGKKGQGAKLEAGMVIAIEPMINLGEADVYKAKDGWTIVATDGKLSAHFEHTIAIRKNQAPEFLSSFDVIDDIILTN